jgi:hypothetical protein
MCYLQKNENKDFVWRLVQSLEGGKKNGENQLNDLGGGTTVADKLFPSPVVSLIF